MSKFSGIDAITALYDVSMAATSSLDLGRVVEQTLSTLAEGMGMERGMLVLRDPATGEATIAAAHGLTQEEIRRGRYNEGEGVVGRVLATGEPMAVPNVGMEPLFLNRTRSRGDLSRSKLSFICVPVKVGEETVGVLSVDRLFKKDSDLDEDVRLLTIVAGYVAQAVRIQRMVETEKASLTDENIQLKRVLNTHFGLENLVGASSAMRAVFEQVKHVAPSRATVLITGESGTGKELIAKAVHFNSTRRDGPFISVSCASLPEGVLENELFGHERGAFTGATKLKKGRFELADGGTIFLDEIGEIPVNLQVKLLRVLQEREIERLGGKATIPVDVRIVAATNRNLATEMRSGNFREDLYYRLNVVPVHLPPLRERKRDVPLLADYFLRKFVEENEKPITGFSREALAAMGKHNWPGNVRELENLVERCVVLANHPVIDLDDLPEEVGGKGSYLPSKNSGDLESAVAETVAPLFDEPPREGVYRAVNDRVTEALVKMALERSGGVKLKAARLLGINRNTLYAKLDEIENADK